MLIIRKSEIKKKRLGLDNTVSLWDDYAIWMRTNLIPRQQYILNLINKKDSIGKAGGGKRN